MKHASQHPTLTRRALLVRAGVTASALLATPLCLPSKAVRAENATDQGAPEDEAPAILVDLTRCVGCNSCALACMAKNHLPEPDVAPDALSNQAYTFIDAVAVETDTGEPAVRYAKRQCMHCLEPACVAACPAAAMYKSEEGPVVYRPGRCLGCRYCQVACPFDVPAFDWANPFTPRISKCFFCYDRQKLGLQPACVEACPTGAIRFGRRGDLLAEAHGHIASLPDRYVDHIFGEYEVGGTSILYLSDVPFERLGFPADLGEEPPPVQTEKVMRVLPAVILGAGALAAGTAAYTHRRTPEAEGRESELQPDSDARDQEGRS